MTSAQSPVVRILHLEDVESDGELVFAALAAYGMQVEPTYARCRDEFVSALQQGGFDAILSDFTLPDFDGLSALQVSLDLQPDLPFIFVSGTIGEERAVAGMKAGASDYVLKGHLDRLGPTLTRAIRDAEQRRTAYATEQALAEVRDRMRFALDSAQVGLWDWEMVSGRVTWSDVNERLHGVEAGTFAGTLDAGIASVHPDDRALVRTATARATPTHPMFRVDYRVFWPDGSLHWIAGVGRVLHDAEGIPVRAIGITYDITSGKRLEEELRQSQRLESIGGLAAGIAHDFNNLVTVINGYCNMLAERLADDASAIADLDEIQRAGGSAAALTRQLLAFSRRQILAPQTVDINIVITDTLRMLRRLVEANIRIDLRCAKQRLAVRVDPRQIEQVLLNLVVNARDAMPNGGVITIETVVRSLDDRADLGAEDGQFVRLMVSDTGTGMSPEVQARVFEPFFTTKEQGLGTGTGLGLATVYGIVKQSGGHIRVWSEVGSGAAFSMYFPVATDDDNAPEALAPAKTAVRAGHARVLVVEDQPALQTLVARMLTASGHTVVLAASAEEAKRLCLNDPRPFDVVLTDVILTGGGGRALGKWVEANREDSKVIYMSGYSAEIFVCEGEPGITLLQKPFSREALLEAIENAMGTVGVLHH